MKDETLFSAYGLAGREIRLMLKSVDVATFDNEKAEKIRRRTRAYVKLLDTAAALWLRKAVSKEFSTTSRNVLASLRLLGRRRPVRPNLARTPAGVLETAVETVARANASIPKTVEEYLRALLVGAQAIRTLPVDAGRIVEVQHFAEGQLPTELVQKWSETAIKEEQARGTLQAKIRDYLFDALEDEQFITIGNRAYNVRRYAKLVARTELRFAQTDATLGLCEVYDNDLVEVSDHATDCDICEEFEGEIYSISGKSREYPALKESPPFHPNCKHSILPTSAEAIEIRRRHE